MHKFLLILIICNSHLVQVRGVWDYNKPFVTGGPLKDEYIFEQMHFHWGPNNSVGSEHTFNNQRYNIFNLILFILFFIV